jgi:hypothetical protein
MDAIKNSEQMGIVKVSMWLGYLVMLGLGVYLAVWQPADGNSTLIVLFCVVMFTANFFAYLGMEKPVKDERARKIGTTAATYSWFVTLCAMCFVYIWDVAFSLGMGVPRFLGIALLVMIVSMAGLNLYLGRKGDVE